MRCDKCWAWWAEAGCTAPRAESNNLRRGWCFGWHSSILSIATQEVRFRKRINPTAYPSVEAFDGRLNITWSHILLKVWDKNSARMSFLIACPTICPPLLTASSLQSQKWTSHLEAIHRNGTEFVNCVTWKNYRRRLKQSEGLVPHKPWLITVEVWEYYEVITQHATFRHILSLFLSRLVV